MKKLLALTVLFFIGINATALATVGGVYCDSGTNCTMTANGMPAVLTLPSGTHTLAQTDSPTLTTPALGTPSAVNLSNATALPTGALPANQIIRAISFTIDGGGSAITTGVKGDLQIPFACTITSNTLLADQTGSIVVNVWKVAYASYPSTVTNKITASAPPTISSAAKSTDATLTGWTTSISAGDTLRFNVDSITTVTRVTLVLACNAT